MIRPRFNVNYPDPFSSLPSLFVNFSMLNNLLHVEPCSLNYKRIQNTNLLKNIKRWCYGVTVQLPNYSTITTCVVNICLGLRNWKANFALICNICLYLKICFNVLIFGKISTKFKISFIFNVNMSYMERQWSVLG